MTLVPGIAHRGYSAKYPENTLASFEAALKLQFHHLELDVHMTKDGIPVVIHDATVNRTTNGKGKVIDYTFQEIRTLRADQNEVIPSLEEVLRFANGRAIVNIELKQCGNRYIGMEEAVLDIIRANDMIDQVFVTSFDHYSIVKLRQLSDDIDLGLIIYGATPSIFGLMAELRADYVSVRYDYVTDAFLQQCTDRSIQVIAWTIDDEIDMREFHQRYPDVWVCTNELEKWISVCQS